MGRNKGNKRSSNGGGAEQEKQASSPPTQQPPALESVADTPVVVQKTEPNVATQAAGGNEKTYRDQLLKLERWQHYFTAALVFAAFAQIFTACWQGCEMQLQNDIIATQMQQTDETLDLMASAERAWLTADIPTAMPENGKPIPTEIYVTNHGHTPAFVSKAGVRPDIRGPSPQEVDLLSAAKNAGILHYEIIPPGKRMKVPQTNQVIFDDPLIKSENGTMFILGNVRYFDITNTLIDLKFAFKFNAATQSYTMHKEANYIQVGEQPIHSSAPSLSE